MNKPGSEPPQCRSGSCCSMALSWAYEFFKPDFARNSVLISNTRINDQARHPDPAGQTQLLSCWQRHRWPESSFPTLPGLTYCRPAGNWIPSDFHRRRRPRPRVRDSSEAYIYKQDPPQFGDGGQPTHSHGGSPLTSISVSTSLSAAGTPRFKRSLKDKNMQAISVEEVKARLDAGETLHLVDVREPADTKSS